MNYESHHNGLRITFRDNCFCNKENPLCIQSATLLEVEVEAGLEMEMEMEVKMEMELSKKKTASGTATETGGKCHSRPHSKDLNERSYCPLAKTTSGAIMKVNSKYKRQEWAP